jgi:predicted transcriptional regulator
MDTTKTKKELIQWIESLNDESVISGLNAIKKSNKKGDWWDDISDAEQQEIKKGLDDARAGRVISNKDFWDKHAERL